MPRLADEIYGRLRDDILDGKFPPGYRLAVPSLAEHLKVSRSPVREAVQRLASDRLAWEKPGRGAIVAQIGLSELVALYEVREVLEGLVARLAVERSGQQFVRSLGRVLNRHRVAVGNNDLPGHFEADAEFHATIRRASKNADAVRMLDQIQAQVRLAMRTTATSAGPEHALADHVSIFEAIRRGDAEGAELLARRHVARLRAVLEHEIDSYAP